MLLPHIIGYVNINNYHMYMYIMI